MSRSGGSDLELGRHVAQHLHREQLATVDLEVAQELAGVPAGVGQARGRA
jgi:hypothetical protein